MERFNNLEGEWKMGRFQIKWKTSSPYCWIASIDGGKTWQNLETDDAEDSSGAVDEAAERFGVGTWSWEVLEN